MKINTIKSDDPFGTRYKPTKGKISDETPLVFSTEETKPVSDLSEKNKNAEKPQRHKPRKSKDSGKAACRNWEGTLTIEFEGDPDTVIVKEPVLAGMILYCNEEKYPVEFSRCSTVRAKNKEKIIYKIHIHGLKDTRSGRAVAGRSAMWAARAEAVTIIAKEWNIKPLRLLDFSIATSKSSAAALKEMKSNVRFMRLRAKTQNKVAKTTNS